MFRWNGRFGWKRRRRSRSARTPSCRSHPPNGFSAQGVPGGPFTPGGVDYTLTNTGQEALDFTAIATASWIQVSSGGGRLEAGASVVVRVSIDAQNAGTLSPGTYSGVVDFDDETNGGNVPVDVVLQVLGEPHLKVWDTLPLLSSGPRGGPFTNLSKTYTVKNIGEQPLDWAVTTPVKPITVTPQQGSLGVGEEQQLTVAIDPVVAAALPLGTYSPRIRFFNRTNFVGSTVRRVTLDVTAPASSGTLASSISQFGITWTFDKDYPVGQFANGDWWVVGPVTIVDIDPRSVSGGRVMNGSMINPSPRGKNDQGYDSTLNTPGNAYKSALNVALDVSPSKPLVISNPASLVSTISLPGSGIRPQLDTAAVLTVLDAPASPDSFRPPYSGSDKTIRYSVGQLNRSLLESLPRVGSAPRIRDVEQNFERVWLDHTPGWSGSYTRPENNMPNYGREIADQVGEAALMLHTDLSLQEKELLLIRFVQLGIDNYGVLLDGGHNNWYGAGGWASGRKWPVIFAGLMLGDSGMTSMPKGWAFGEDSQDLPRRRDLTRRLQPRPRGLRRPARGNARLGHVPQLGLLEGRRGLVRATPTASAARPTPGGARSWPARSWGPRRSGTIRRCSTTRSAFSPPTSSGA